MLEKTENGHDACDPDVDAENAFGQHIIDLLTTAMRRTRYAKQNEAFRNTAGTTTRVLEKTQRITEREEALFE